LLLILTNYNPQMHRKIVYIFILLVSQLALAQHKPRTVLKGKVTLDTLSVSGVVVMNSATGKGARTDASGEFALYAKTNDTLVFSGPSLVTQRLILTEKDFNVTVLPISLLFKATELDEVVVSVLSGDLKRDAERIKVTTIDPKINFKQVHKMRFTSDAQTKVRNEAMPGNLEGGIYSSVDIMKVAELIGSIFKKEEKEKKIIFTSSKIFQEAVREKLSLTFFTETLRLKEDEIGLFLAYCDSDLAVKELLQVNKEFELIELLLDKRTTYVSPSETKE
jgi:hypothetical protein